MTFKKIAVFGTGLMGKGIVQVIASAGCEVIVYSQSSNAFERFNNYLFYEQEKKRLLKEDVAYIQNLVSFKSYDDMDLLFEMDLVIETVKEDKSYKKKLLKKVSGFIGSDCIVVSNTSTYSITELGACLSTPAKLCGMHFFSPVPLMDLIEVIRGMASSEETINKVVRFSKELAKQPVVVKDTPGFVLNRLMAPYIKEAVALLEEGVASAIDIDKAVSSGVGLKIGPLQLADLIGIDVIKACMDNLYYEYRDNRYASTLITNMVRANMLGKKTKDGFYQYN